MGRKKRDKEMERKEREEEDEEEGQWGCTVPLLPVTAELRFLESKGPGVSGRVGAGEVVDGDGVVGASVIYATKKNNDNKHVNRKVNRKGWTKDKTTMTRGKKLP